MTSFIEEHRGDYWVESICKVLPRAPWRSFEVVEYATHEWVDWFNNRRLLEPIESIPPAEAEARYYVSWTKQPWPDNLNQMASGKPEAVQAGFIRSLRSILVLSYASQVAQELSRPRFRRPAKWSRTRRSLADLTFSKQLDAKGTGGLRSAP